MAAIEIPAPCEQAVALLQDSPLLRALDPEEQHAVMQEVVWLRLPGGEDLIRQGDAGDSLYLVVTGRLHALDGSGPEQRLVNTVSGGEAVGEVALLTGDRRTVTLRAARDCLLARLSKSAFERLSARSPAVALALSREIVKRYRATEQGRPDARGHQSVVVLVPLHPGLDVRGLAQALSETLARWGRVAWFDRLRVEAALGQEGAERGLAATADSFSAWLSDQEFSHRHVILVAQDADDDWTRLCQRQADLTLLLADASASAPPLTASRRPRWLADAARRTEVVLLHPRQIDVPRGTDRWRRLLPAARHHHLRQGVPADVDRLARRVGGRAVALALSGGGARGFAHIGVIKALVEGSVPVDLVCGTSIGAVIGAQWAMGWDVETMIRKTRRAFLESGRIYDITLPVVSLIAGKKLARAMRRLFGEVQIEDLWLPFFCVSANLNHAKTVIHDSGPLWHWVRTSGSIPGIAPPVPLGEDLLIDGGVLDNLPAEEAGKRVQGSVIACNVLAPVDHLACSAPLEGIRPLQLLWRRFHPVRPDRSLPTIFDILTRTVYLSHASRTAQVASKAEIYLEPPTSDFNTLDPRPIDQIIQAGYRYTIDRMAQGDFQY